MPRLAHFGSNAALIDAVRVRAFTIPTDLPESDGTLEWNQTTMVLAEIDAGGHIGLGYTYADLATAELIRNTLADVLLGCDAFQTTALWWAMVRRIRNLGRQGICSMAISALDIALWDLKAKLLGVPVLQLMGGPVRSSVALYGSGGFCSYTDDQLTRQFRGWIDEGFTMVKMKIGRDPIADLHRVYVARKAIGETAQLFVDANGAFSRKQALDMAAHLEHYDVRWFEEPVSSDALADLHALRVRVAPTIEIAAGEYGYDTLYFRRMLEAGAVDVLQADATRCGGFTGFLQASALCTAFDVPLSAHTAPLLHAHVGCAAPKLRHVEYFHDHARIERKFFDGAAQPQNGHLAPDSARPGLGIDLRASDAERYAA